jgi:hypothetical protein
MKTMFTKTKIVLSVFALVLSTTALTAQTIITIDNNPGSTTTYQTIQEAHDAAQPGDIIYVQPSGSSYGSVNIRKPLTIIGRSHSEPTKVSRLSIVRQGANDITLRGLYMNGFDYDSNSPEPLLRENLVITNCYIVGGITLGETDNSYIRGNVLGNFSVGISISSFANNVLITNNIIARGISSVNNQSTLIANNIFRRSSSGQIIISNNDPNNPLILANNMFIFNNNSDQNVSLSGSGGFGLSNNLTYNYGSGNVNFNHTGSGAYSNSGALVNTDPLFVNIDPTNSSSLAGTSLYRPENVPDEDLRLQAGSAALTGGSGGTEIGLYNNNYNYNHLGQPAGYPTLDIESYDVAVPKDSNINVTITAKAY